MGIPTSEVGYASAMPRREDHDIHKDIWGIERKTFLERKHPVVFPALPTGWQHCPDARG